MKKSNFLSLNIAITGLLMFTSGCSSIIDARKQKRPYMENFYSGNIKEAATDLTSEAEAHTGTGDDLMWLLEAGTANFLASEYKKSLNAFEQCELTLKDFRDRAVLNAREGGVEGGAIFTNANAIPYRGMYLDRVMLNSYKALDYFALGQPEEAQVELRRMRDAQKNIVKQFQEEIEKLQKDIDEQNIKNNKEASKIGGGNTSVTFESLLQNPVINEAYTTSAKKANKLYGNLSNPFVTYFSAVGYLMEHNYGEAMVDFRNLYKMLPASRLIQRDYVTCAAKIGGKIPDKLKKTPKWDYPLDSKIVYIFFFNGKAPAMKQRKFQIVLPFVGYTGIAFPQYEYFKSSMSALQLDFTYDKQKITEKTDQIADFDAIMSEEYNKRLPTMITRIVISTLTKAIGSYAAIAAARQAGTGAEIGAYALTGLYKWMFNTADTRCWETLPQEIQVAHIPIPDNRTFTLIPQINEKNITDKKREIKLKKTTKVAIVYIRALSVDNMIYKVFEFDR